MQAVPSRQVCNSSIPKVGKLYYNKIKSELDFEEMEAENEKDSIGIYDFSYYAYWL